MGDVYTNPPQSRNEAILNSIVEGTEYTAPPQSRIEDLLLEVKEVIEEGGHDESATRASIAPTESDAAHASKRIEIDEQFYLSDDKLYIATKVIAQGTAIVTSGAGQNCEVSDSVTGQIADRVDWKSNGVLGAKNLLTTAFTTAKTITTGGANITFTPNSDRSITINGTTGSSQINYTILDSSIDEQKEVLKDIVNINSDIILSGCPSGGGDDTYRLSWYLATGSGTQKDIGNGITFKATNYNSGNIAINIGKNQTISNKTFYPMIRLATDTDTTYQPYAQTNRELTLGKTDTTVIGNVEYGAKSANAYSANDLFVCNGKIGKATTGIAVGDTLTLNGNYTETTIGALITAILNA